MTAPKRIALVGCGAIGTAVLELLRDDPALKVTTVVVPADARPPRRPRRACRVP
ncbi:aspartate dehydrogenase, partial [Variovorax sp. CT11-76]